MTIVPILAGAPEPVVIEGVGLPVVEGVPVKHANLLLSSRESSRGED